MIDSLKLQIGTRPVLRQPAVVLAMLGAFLILLLAAALYLNRTMTAGPATAPPPRLSPLEMDVRHILPLPRADAQARNASVPIVDDPNPPASAFHVQFVQAFARQRSVDCLTSAIYYEAGQESTEGQQAVAQVVLNRVRHPAFPNSICGVVYQGSNRRTGCQFTFTCDGSLARAPSASGWARARRVAEAALTGQVYAPVGYATHYHADYVVPYWSSSLLKTAVIGAHIFYRWPGAAGRADAFTARYAGLEPEITITPATAEAPAEIVTDNPALLPRPATPEERAEELDDFGLLSYRSRSKAPAPSETASPDVDEAVRSAFGPAAAAGRNVVAAR